MESMHSNAPDFFVDSALVNLVNEGNKEIPKPILEQKQSATVAKQLSADVKQEKHPPVVSISKGENNSQPESSETVESKSQSVLMQESEPVADAKANEIMAVEPMKNFRVILSDTNGMIST